MIYMWLILILLMIVALIILMIWKELVLFLIIYCVCGKNIFY